MLRLFYLSLLLLNPLAAAEFTANVMAPLWVTDNARFRQQLAIAKAIGVDAVSVDVWWGKVEANGDQQFDWQYYDNLFTDIREAGLDIVPIMALHQCGGNVGDDCDIPLPHWLWQHFHAHGVSTADLQYKSEYGYQSVETLSLWADTWVVPQYIEFMQAFAERYAAIASDIQEVNVSMGPAGELRYPSYNSHDQGKTSYPGRGGFQAYSALAVADFQHAMQQKYQHLAALNIAWQQQLNSFSEVMPPSDAAQFVSSGAMYQSQYGRDFTRWYHQALLNHGKRVLGAAEQGLKALPENIPLGYKIPGIHWKMAAPDFSRRSAEIAAGLIDSASGFDADNGFGYAGIVALAQHNMPGQRAIVLHFTALEMADNAQSDSYSLAKTLVHWVGAEAVKQGVTVKGENALAAGVLHETGWANIRDALASGGYQGLTILRIEQVTADALGQEQYQQLIKHYKIKR